MSTRDRGRKHVEGGRSPRLDPVWDAEDRRRVLGDERPRQLPLRRRRQLGGVGCQQRRLEHARAPIGVEPVQQAVLAGGDGHARLHQVGHPRDPPAFRRGVVPSLQEEVRRRVRDRGEPGLGHEGDHARRVGLVVGRERAGVARRHRTVDPPLEHRGRKVLERAGGRIVGLVDVHVDSDAVALGQVQTVVDVRTPVGVRPFVVRHAADQVGTFLERCLEEVGGPRVLTDPLLREGDDLDVGEFGARLPGGEDASEGRQTADGVDVDVRSNPRTAVPDVGLDRPNRPLSHVDDGVRPFSGVDALDGRRERARVVRGQIRLDVGLVEVDVWIDEAGGDQPARGVEGAVGLSVGALVADGDNHSVRDRDGRLVASSGEPCPLDEYVGCHGSPSLRPLKNVESVVT